MAYSKDPYVLGTVRRMLGRLIVLAPRQEWVPTSVNVRLFLTMWMVTCYPETVFESMEDPVSQAVLHFAHLALAGLQETTRNILAGLRRTRTSCAGGWPCTSGPTRRGRPR